jgi:transcriptional regulator with XRE-family HTH domain
MSDSIDSIKAQLWQKMSTKEYRDNFVAAHLSTGIAAQIQALREDRGWTQQQLGDKVGMTQARISLMEGPGYDSYTFSTLKRLATAFDVAIIARFAAFSELAAWTADLSPRKLAVVSFARDTIAPTHPEESPLQAAAVGAEAGAKQAVSVAHHGLRQFGAEYEPEYERGPFASQIRRRQPSGGFLPSLGSIHR